MCNLDNCMVDEARTQVLTGVMNGKRKTLDMTLKSIPFFKRRYFSKTIEPLTDEAAVVDSPTYSVLVRAADASVEYGDNDAFDANWKSMCEASAKELFDTERLERLPSYVQARLIDDIVNFAIAYSRRAVECNAYSKEWSEKVIGTFGAHEINGPKRRFMTNKALFITEVDALSDFIDKVELNLGVSESDILIDWSRHVDMKNITLEHIEFLSRGFHYTSEILDNLFFRGNENPDVLCEFLNSHSHLRGLGNANVTDFIETHHAKIKFAADILFYALTERGETHATVARRVMAVISDSADDKPLIERTTACHMLIGFGKDIPEVMMETFVRSPHFQQNNFFAFNQYFISDSVNEKTLLVALSYPELIGAVVNSQHATGRVLEFAAHLNDDMGLGLESVILNHPNVKDSTLEHQVSINAEDETLGAEAIKNEVLPPDTAMNHLKVRKAAYRKTDLMKHFATRSDLEFKHVKFLLEEELEEVDEALRQNPFTRAIVGRLV